MLMMSFDDVLTRANFSFVYFLQFYILNFFDIVQWGGGLNPQTSPLATPLLTQNTYAYHTRTFQSSDGTRSRERLEFMKYLQFTGVITPPSVSAASVRRNFHATMA